MPVTDGWIPVSRTPSGIVDGRREDAFVHAAEIKGDDKRHSTYAIVYALLAIAEVLAAKKSGAHD